MAFAFFPLRTTAPTVAEVSLEKVHATKLHVLLIQKLNKRNKCKTMNLGAFGAPNEEKSCNVK